MTHSESPAAYRFRRRDTIPPTGPLGFGTKNGVKPSSTPLDDGSGNTTTTTKNGASSPWIWRTPSTKLVGPAFFVKSDEKRWVWPSNRDLCYSNDSFVLFGPEKIPSKKREYNKATLQAHSSSPLASTGPSRKDERTQVEAINSPFT